MRIVDYVSVYIYAKYLTGVFSMRVVNIKPGDGMSCMGGLRFKLDMHHMMSPILVVMERGPGNLTTFVRKIMFLIHKQHMNITNKYVCRYCGIYENLASRGSHRRATGYFLGQGTPTTPVQTSLTEDYTHTRVCD